MTGSSPWEMRVKEFIFAPAESPTPMCHAATLAETEPGRYCAAWFGGAAEGAADVAIWLAQRTSGGWSAPRKMTRVRDEAHWNPVLFHDAASNETHLFFKVGMKIPDWETWVMRSGDGGRTWSQPVELAPGDRGGRGPDKNKPVRLSDGDWLAPSSKENEQEWRAFVDRSGDRGRTWSAAAPVPMDIEKLVAARRGGAAGVMSGGTPGATGVIQPALWESAPGRVHMLLRSTIGRACRSDSADGGRTWSAVRPLDIPNNNSGLDLAALPDGRLVLVCNPVAENWGLRTPLSILISDDNGETWSAATELENEPAVDGQRPRPEFSYPSVIVGHGGQVALVYTWKRKSIVFAEGILS
jgi:predicted neuraminidase